MGSISCILHASRYEVFTTWYYVQQHSNIWNWTLVFWWVYKYLPLATSCKINDKINFWYSYYDLSTIEGKLLTIFTDGTNDISSREPNYNQILIFNSASDRKEFEEYLEYHFDDFSDQEIMKDYEYQILEDNKANGGGLTYSTFQVAKTEKIYSMWLGEING